MKSQKLKSQKLHLPILEINCKNLHPQIKPSYTVYDARPRFEQSRPKDVIFQSSLKTNKCYIY